MSRLISFVTFLFLISKISDAQKSFEGTLTYKSEYKFDISPEMKKLGVTEKVLIEKMKSEGTWADSLRITYKRDDFILYNYASPATWSVYKGETNKLYSFEENDPDSICTVTDVSIDLEEHMTGIKPVIGLTGDSVQVNGWMCEEVKVIWRSGTYKYYFHRSSFPLDSTLYKNYVYDGWAGYLKIAHALPIRIVKTINGIGTITQTLINYKEEKVDDKIFYVPELVSDQSLNVIKMANRELMRIKK